MNTRIRIFFTILLVTIISLLIGHFLIDENFHGYLYVVGFFLFVYIIIYMLFGLSRLITYIIYGVFLIPILLFVREFQLLLLSIFTIVVVLNPLSFIEVYLDEKLPEQQVITYGFIPRGLYKIFYEYRRAMKEHFHLPQVKKLYTKKSYQYLRTFSVIALFGMLVFLLTFSARGIYISQGLGFVSLLTIYISVVLTMAVMVLYKSGFTSMFRVFKIFTFPAVIYILAYFNINIYVKISLLTINILGMIGVIANEVYLYYTRVIYESYSYQDFKNNEKVYANGLYEPFSYNELKVATYKYSIKINEDLFNKSFHDLIVFLNLRRIILTAYLVKEDKIFLYLEFYNLKTVTRVETKLKQLFDTKIDKTLITDDNYYENKFLHNHEYIIARAQSLAHLLKDLSINKPIIVASSMYFKDFNNAKQIITKYNYKITEEKENYIHLEVYLKVNNKDFLIETALRGLLLDMLVHGGTFIRVMVYY